MMSKKLNELEAFGKDGELRVIVEVPRGSSVKLNYKPKLRSFVVSRALPLGLTYPLIGASFRAPKAMMATHWTRLRCMRLRRIPASFFRASR